jgi:hypothetical protein
MGQWLGFGDGHDSAVPSSGTYSGTNQSCSGSSGSTTLTCGGTFTAGDIILIHQTRGTGVGNWELNQVVSDNGATLTLKYALSNTYTDSGDSQAQVIEVKEYAGGTISGTLTCNAWDGDKGGILPILCSGKLTISGTVHANAKGFRGGPVQTGTPKKTGYQGEGATGAYSTSASANGNGGGGGGTSGCGFDILGGGGGGGLGTGGTAGGSGQCTAGAAGGTDGGATLADMVMGGGGGASGLGARDTATGVGGDGGGIIIIFARELAISGSVTSNGGNGTNGAGSDNYYGGGGGGAGGSILVKTQTGTLGTNKITASNGSGAAGGGNGNAGGNGGNGRVRVESCSYTGSANDPTPSYSTGGHDFCAVLGGMI